MRDHVLVAMSAIISYTYNFAGIPSLIQPFPLLHYNDPTAGLSDTHLRPLCTTLPLLDGFGWEVAILHV